MVELSVRKSIYSNFLNIVINESNSITKLVRLTSQAYYITFLTNLQVHSTKQKLKLRICDTIEGNESLVKKCWFLVSYAT